MEGCYPPDGPLVILLLGALDKIQSSLTRNKGAGLEASIESPCLKGPRMTVW